MSSIAADLKSAEGQLLAYVESAPLVFGPTAASCLDIRPIRPPPSTHYSLQVPIDHLNHSMTYIPPLRYILQDSVRWSF